jgi:ATP-binding protein involved in chromosome partitioning
VTLDVGTGPQAVATGADGRFRADFQLFGAGGGEMLSKKHGFPVLGHVPLNPVVRAGGDAGDPVTVAQPDSPIARSFREIAGRVAQRVAIKSMQALPILQ